jgi:probable F420-dependent oxidoreductase
VKVRIGYGPGIGHASASGEWFGGFVDSLEELGFDSLWLPERLAGPSTDPLVGLAFAAGRTKRLKLGTSVLVLPGRNPVVLAKELASLDALSGGRLLPAFGLGVADPNEQQAFGVQRTERSALFDEALGLMRRAWSGEVVDHDGDHFHVHGFRLAVLPAQKVLEVWLGGVAPSELRRVGRQSDGWLPSFISPDEAAASRLIVEQTAADAGRSIDPEHFGALVTYTFGEIPDRFRAFLETRKPGVDPASIVASGTSGIRTILQRFLDNGFSKFVLAPIAPLPDTRAELEMLAAEVLPLQN